MPDGSWNSASGGNWSNTLRWLSGIVADGATFTATFYRDIVGAVNITVDTNRTIGTMTFNDANPTGTWDFLRSGAVTLTLDNGASKPVLDSLFGTTANNLGARFEGMLAGTNGFRKTGSGNILFRNTASIITGTVDIDAGQVFMSSNPLMSRALSSSRMLTGITSYSLNGSSTIFGINTQDPETFPSSFSGSGSVLVRINVGNASTRRVTFNPGAFTNLNNGSSTYGFGLVSSSSAGTNDSAAVIIHEFAAKTSFIFPSASAVSTSGYILFNNSSDLTSSTNISIISDTSSGINNAYLYNSTASSKLVITGTINRTGASAAAGITFNICGTNTTENELSGVISNSVGSLALSKLDGGTWILSGTNTHTGLNTLTDGILNIRNGSALGSSATGNVTLSSGTLEIQGGININKSTPTFALNGSVIKNISGANTLTTGAATLNASTTFNIDAGSLNMAGAIGGASGLSLIKSGSGTFRLSSDSSSYLGPTVVQLGLLEFALVRDADSASNSSLGKPASAQATITIGASGSAGLSHIGTTASSTNRNITFSASADTTLTLDSSGSGSGSVTYSSGGAFSISGAGAHTILFSGTNANQSSFLRTIPDGGSGVTNITKSGSSSWTLSAITSTGTLICNGGTINLGTSNVTTPSSLTVNGGIVAINNGNTVSLNTTMNGGKVTAVLTGAKTLTVTSSATEVSPAGLDPDNSDGNNSLTGNISVAGCLDLIISSGADPSTAGKGQVLGNSNTVTVASGGIIRTSIVSNQNGQARYKNLTLQNNSAIKIGLAA